MTHGPVAIADATHVVAPYDAAKWAVVPSTNGGRWRPEHVLREALRIAGILMPAVQDGRADCYCSESSTLGKGGVCRQ